MFARVAQPMRRVIQTQTRGFAGHGHAAPVAQPGDFISKPAMAPGNVAFLGETLSGIVASATGGSTFASLSTRGLWPWMAGFPMTFWLIGKMTIDRACARGPGGCRICVRARVH